MCEKVEINIEYSIQVQLNTRRKVISVQLEENKLLSLLRYTLLLFLPDKVISLFIHMSKK